MIDGERMSFTPLPLGTLDIIERMKEDLCLDKEMMRSFPIVGFLLSVNHHRETIAKIAALFARLLSGLGLISSWRIVLMRIWSPCLSVGWLQTRCGYTA